MTPAGNPSLQVSQNELQAMAYSDPLTGLGNRYRLRDKVRLLAAERSQDPAPFTICIANLDGFKPINDLFGAEAGDEILCQVAHRLKACMPDGATVTRHDGDEFAFVLPLVFDRSSAERVGQMMKDVLSAPYDLATGMFVSPHLLALPSTLLPGKSMRNCLKARRPRFTGPSGVAAVKLQCIRAKSRRR